jgi:hypothetical protein
LDRIERVSPLVGVEQPGFLIDLAAVLEDLDLATGLVLDGLADEADTS